MTIDISELITNIRAWEAADKAYKQAHDAYLLSEEVEPKDHDAAQCAWDKRTTTYHDRNDAAMAVHGSFHDDTDLAAFVALADHCEQLQVRIDDLETKEKNRGKWCEECHGYGYDVFDLNCATCKVCGGEGMVWGEHK